MRLCSDSACFRSSRAYARRCAFASRLTSLLARDSWSASRSKTCQISNVTATTVAGSRMPALVASSTACTRPDGVAKGETTYLLPELEHCIVERPSLAPQQLCFAHLEGLELALEGLPALHDRRGFSPASLQPGSRTQQGAHYSGFDRQCHTEPCSRWHLHATSTAQPQRRSQTVPERTALSQPRAPRTVQRRSGTRLPWPRCMSLGLPGRPAAAGMRSRRAGLPRQLRCAAGPQ